MKLTKIRFASLELIKSVPFSVRSGCVEAVYINHSRFSIFQCQTNII